MAQLEALHSLIPMNPASISFVYIYMPVCLLVYYLLPAALRPAALLVSSIGFSLLGTAQQLPLMLASAAVDFLLLKGLTTINGNVYRRILLVLCISKNAALIGYFGIIAGTNASTMQQGVFIYCILGIRAAIEFYRSDYTLPPSIIRFANYMLFFPRLYAGPLSKYGDFLGEHGSTEFDADEILTGFGRFAGGLFKYAVLGKGLFFLYSSIRAIPGDALSVLSSWSLVAAFALSVYFTMSGLSDIARGIAGMFFIKLPQNFYYPYQSRSVTDFFERFNMTLGSFFRDCVYEPLAARKYVAAGPLSILLIVTLWSLWFGMRANCLMWGAFVALFIIMEKYIYPKLLAAVPTLFCRVYALFIVIIGFALLSGDTPSQSGGIILRMFGANNTPAIDGSILYLLSSNWLLILISLFLSTSALSLLTGLVRKTWPRVSRIVFAAIDCAVILMFTALTLGGAAL